MRLPSASLAATAPCPKGVAAASRLTVAGSPTDKLPIYPVDRATNRLGKLMCLERAIALRDDRFAPINYSGTEHDTHSY